MFACLLEKLLYREFTLELSASYEEDEKNNEEYLCCARVWGSHRVFSQLFSRTKQS